MSLTLGGIIQDVRLRSPHYGSDTIPSRVLGQALGIAQRKLAQLATQRSSTYLAQHFTVAFALSLNNTVGIAGVGTTGGLPASADLTGGLTTAEQNFGIAPAYDLDSAVVLVTPVPVASATATSVTVLGSPGWTTDQYLGAVVWIRDGDGVPQIRDILSNTADTLVVDTWGTVPTTTSLVTVIASVPLAIDQMAVATSLPALTQSTGYLVRLDASGNPYLDLTKPLVTAYTQGTPLPAFDRLLGVQCFWTGAATAESATMPNSLAMWSTTIPIVAYDNAVRRPYDLACYTLGTDLFLTGTTTGWLGAQNLEVRYVPIPPLFSTGATALSEYFLLPDTAHDVLVAEGEAMAAEYAVAKGLPADVLGARQKLAQSTAFWLKSVGQQTGGYIRTSRRNR